jgi:hypothetical protein
VKTGSSASSIATRMSPETRALIVADSAPLWPIHGGDNMLTTMSLFAVMNGRNTNRGRCRRRR